MSSNPYQSPNAASQKLSGRRTYWYYSFVAPISVMVFWVGVTLGILGSVITFVPGGGANWYASTSVFISAGLFANSKKYRIASAVLLVLCLAATYNAYIAGIEHQEFLRTRSN